jgi:hypothetical protein
MLRITVTENALEERWILQGQLTKQSIAELVSSWRTSTAQPSTRPRVVDLNGVTSIDKSGEEALSMMVDDGATFVASGVYTKHLLDQLQAPRKHKWTAGFSPAPAITSANAGDKRFSQLLWPDKDREEWFFLKENHVQILGFGLNQLRNRRSPQTAPKTEFESQLDITPLENNLRRQLSIVRLTHTYARRSSEGAKGWPDGAATVAGGGLAGGRKVDLVEYVEQIRP